MTMILAVRGSVAALTVSLFLTGCRGDGSSPVEASPASMVSTVKRTVPVPASTVSSHPARKAVRPLFVPQLSPEAPAAAPTAGPVAAPRRPRPIPRLVTPDLDEEPEEEEGPELVLVGVTVIGSETEAVIEEDAEVTHRVRLGDEVAGFRIAEISGESVVLRREDETRSLSLGEGKPDGSVQFLYGTGSLKLTGESNSALAVLPPHLLSIVNRVMPRTGELRRVRTDQNNGQTIYRVQRREDGRDWELRLSATGEILRIEQEVSHDAIPAVVLTAANGAVPGYRVNTEDTPKLTERGAERYYEIEVRRDGGREEVDLRIAADGRIIGRD